MLYALKKQKWRLEIEMSLLLRLLKKLWVLKKKHPQLRTYTYRSLVKSVKKRNDVCHIVASGFSALDAYKHNVVKKNDYIIGFNFSAFLPYNFDLYFCEDNSLVIKCETAKTDGIKKQALLLNKCKDRISNLVWKNIYSSENLFYAEQFQQNNIDYSIVMDRQIISENDKIVKQLLAKPGIMMPQWYTTTITATMLAYHAGFKKIIVHGLDFGGSHVYFDKELQKQVGMELLDPYEKAKQQPVYNGQEWIWPLLIDALSAKGVSVYCASQNSRFKEYASVYNT